MVDDEAYARAVLRHTELVLQMFVGERLITKIFGRVFQSHAMGRLVIAHFDWKAGVGEPPTLARLQAETGCGRTLAAFVGMAKVARLLAAEPNSADRRQKILVPGPRVVAGLRDWLHHHLCLAEAMQTMPPGCAQRLLDDVEYFERLVRSTPIVIEGVVEARMRFRLWDWFERHDSGLRMAYALLRAHYSACLERGMDLLEPVELNVNGAQVAQLLALSKSHVRNVFNGAERLGILTHDEARRRVSLSTAFLREARACFVDLMGLFAQAHDRAEALGNAATGGVSRRRPSARAPAPPTAGCRPGRRAGTRSCRRRFRRGRAGAVRWCGPGGGRLRCRRGRGR